MLQVENVFGNITFPDLKYREHTKVKNLKKKKKRPQAEGSDGLRRLSFPTTGVLL